MSRLTKTQARLHEEAEELLSQDALSHDEKMFVIQHWQESATSVNSSAGAFFTPLGLATDFTIECGNPRSVIDLCAGIGTLSYALHRAQRDPGRFVCVEMNPEYVRVGKKILPEANWVTSSIFAPAVLDLGRFDLAISNPPFGQVKRDGNAPRYKGAEFEYHVIDLGAHMADYGAFILPQGSLGWSYSGKPHYQEESPQKHTRFQKQTGIDLEVGCGIDTTYYAEDWHLVKVSVEIAIADFSEAGGVRPDASRDEAEPDLFTHLAEVSA